MYNFNADEKEAIKICIICGHKKMHTQNISFVKFIRFVI